MNTGSVCPAGHRSTEPDYCSVCGAAMRGSKSAAPGVATSAVSPGVPCPDCGEPRTSGARFCEVCRFDFGVAASPAWELSVETDPALDDERDAATPLQRSVRLVPFTAAEVLVGRRDDVRDIHPQLALDDPGTSRRHLKLLRSAQGEVQLQDLASTNGTLVNGTVVPPGTRRVLREGDQVTLGRWTRIVLRASS